MKILHVINSLGPGGAERQLANLLGPLREMGAENYLATLQPNYANEERVVPSVVGYEPALLHRGLVTTFPRLVAMAREVDLVHTHLPWSDISGRLAARAAHKPVFSTFHSTWYDTAHMQALSFQPRQKARAVHLLDRITARSAAGFFAVSHAAKETHARALNIAPDRIIVLPNSIDLREFDRTRYPDRDRTREELGFSPTSMAITVVARLYPQKDHATAVKAVGALAREMPVHLYLVGAGPLERRLRALARKHHAPVTFLGARQDVVRVLSASDLFLLPTFFEGHSLALMEAMAMGLPCVASDIPENRETGADAVAYVPPGNAEDLTNCLRAVLADPDRMDAMGRQARASAQRFDVRRAARRLINAYRQALGDDLAPTG